MKEFLLSDGVVFADRGYTVVLHRPHPSADGYGFRQQVDLVAGPFRGSIEAEAYVHVSTLRRFHDSVAVLYRNLTGEAELGGYENFSLTLKGDGLGHICVQVTALAGSSMDTKLSYRFDIDQTQLLGVMEALGEFMAG